MKKNSSLTRWWDIHVGIGGKGDVKRKGTRFWGKKNDIFSTSFVQLHLHVLNIGFCLIFLFPKPCFLPFYASNSYIPPTFLLENVFIIECHNNIYTLQQAGYIQL